MSSIATLAREFDAQPAEVRAFAGDLIPADTNDITDLPADAVEVIRDAWNAAL